MNLEQHVPMEVASVSIPSTKLFDFSSDRKPPCRVIQWKISIYRVAQAGSELDAVPCAGISSLGRRLSSTNVESGRCTAVVCRFCRFLLTSQD